MKLLPSLLLFAASAVASTLSHADPAAEAKAKKTARETAALTPEEERSTFVLPEGYVADLIAAEPLVQEPVLAVWDGDGAMYVAEMRSYMQDEEGTGTKTLKNGIIKRLTSSKGDGVMDKMTIFAQGLNLPRMILPLADGIAVVETDDTSIWKFRDTKGDGVSDEKTLLFQGRSGDPNHSVEHQDSGLDWNLDNWIYISYGRERYRFTDGAWKAQGTRGLWSQWGITHDDEGRVFFSENSTPAMGFNMPRHYWSLLDRLKDNGAKGDEPIALTPSWDPVFLTAKNICKRDDRGPEAGPRKEFTSICGQSVFRGTALPAEARGDYFFCDPTIHVVRRARIENQNGRLFFSNRYGQDEFMLSSDILFRPVNTAVGPDGCLTVVDMYRGIIQDAPWLSLGPRKFIKDSGLGAQVQRGRIWRIRQRDLTATAAPKMSTETTAQLVRHLENPNGWWRDTAQKLIILRSDRESVAPQLMELARDHKNSLARLHALWTLEGMNRAEPALLQALWRDSDPRIRAAAIHISEPFFEKNDAAMLEAIAPVAASESDAEVAKQIILTLAWATDPRAGAIIEKLTERFLAHEGVFLAAALALWKQETPLIARIKSGEAFEGIKDSGERAAAAARWTHGLAQWNRALKLPADMPKDERALITKGEDTFFQICVSCHGADGKGTGIPGSDQLIAPALAGSLRAKGSPANLVPVLMSGLLGPIAGKTYQGQMMVPAAALGITRDDRIAEVLSYIRYAWGNNAPVVTKDEVISFRKASASRTTPWSDEELKQQAAK